jgi:predicted phosphodiesterase
MRHLVLSDVHANLPALDAVLSHAGGRGYDDVVFLGDAVGYYPHAEEAVQRLIELAPRVAILGNHDATLLAIVDGEVVERHDAGLVVEVLARQAETLSDDSVRFLRDLRAHVLTGSWEAAHGALRQPWEYIASLAAAQANLEHMERPLLFVGHTHTPKVFAAVEAGGQRMWRTVTFRHDLGHYRLPPYARVIANPGAVGQPRDQIPLAAYALFDEDARTLEFHRVVFDIGSVQSDVRAAGYPEVLAARLEVGR